MKILVTGADGFLGRHVVAAALSAGHGVRAMVGPRASTSPFTTSGSLESFRADLLGAEPLEPAFEGVDVLVHLAAVVVGNDRERSAVNADGTARLLAAMLQTATRRVVLASSLSVYDWRKVGGMLTERTPLRTADSAGDSYSSSKLRQEEVARALAARHGWALTVLRPSSLWGAGRMQGGETGRRFGPFFAVVGPRRPLRLCYVENCADAFLRAVAWDAPAVRTFNVVDPFEIRAWDYARICLATARDRALRLPLPYRVTRSCLRALDWALRDLGRERFGAPGILRLSRFDTEFAPAACSAEAVLSGLGWTPRFRFEEALARVSCAVAGAQAESESRDRTPTW